MLTPARKRGKTWKWEILLARLNGEKTEARGKLTPL